MSWFSTPTPDPRQANTISDKQMAGLQRRAKLRHDRDRFTTRQVNQRLASERQRRRSIWS